jgi:hypothetical protein
MTSDFHTYEVARILLVSVCYQNGDLLILLVCVSIHSRFLERMSSYPHFANLFHSYMKVSIEKIKQDS